jgi:hypothetical protein
MANLTSGGLEIRTTMATGARWGLAGVVLGVIMVLALAGGADAGGSVRSPVRLVEGAAHEGNPRP